jgi:uncharacterized SAM-dependent methyltransferase
MDTEITCSEIEQRLIIGLNRDDDKFIPCEFCYNDIGSSLFQDLCNEPDYYLSRLERSMLSKHQAEILEILSERDVFELGAGDCSKMCKLTEHDHSFKFRYFPNDINASILESGVENYAISNPSHTVKGIPGDYFEALNEFASLSNSKKAVLFLGSTVGNFSGEQRKHLFDNIQEVLGPEDIFVLACDLFKSRSTISKAYNGSSRIVREMERQSLHYLNKLYDGDFQVDEFTHYCDFNCNSMYVESRLYSLTDQSVSLKKLGLEFELKAGQSILMDKTWKPTLAQLRSNFDESFWSIQKIFKDDLLPYALIVGKVKGG